MNYIDYMDQGGLASYPYYTTDTLKTPILDALGIKLKYPPVKYGIDFIQVFRDGFSPKTVDVKNSTVASNDSKSGDNPSIDRDNPTSKRNYFQYLSKLGGVSGAGLYHFINHQQGT